MLLREVDPIPEEGDILLNPLVNLCADTAPKEKLDTLQIRRIHVEYQSKVLCLLVHGFYGNLKGERGWVEGHMTHA